MSFWQKVIANWRDVRTFGPGVLMRHIRSGTPIPLRGLGQIALRHSNSDMECFRQVFQRGEYNIGHLKAVQDRINRRYEEIVESGLTPVIVDGGANVGASAIWFAKQFSLARIKAIEPDEANFRLLKINTSTYQNVDPVFAALGATPGFVEVTNSEGPGWAVQTRRADVGLPVTGVTEAQLSVENSRLFLVKIDIEGFEIDVFSGRLDWIADAYVVVIEPHDWMLPGEFSSRNFMKAMVEHEFEIFIIGENLFFVRN
jgi:FkbM family methyltransferase